jgi:hypothetical protein
MVAWFVSRKPGERFGLIPIKLSHAKAKSIVKTRRDISYWLNGKKRLKRGRKAAIPAGLFAFLGIAIP